MDIGRLVTSETAEITIRDNLGQETDLVIEVYGSDSAKYRALTKEIAALKRENAYEDTAENDAKHLAQLTKTWRNASLNGEELEPTLENFERVYKVSAPIRDQVNIAILRRANFLPKA